VKSNKFLSPKGVRLRKVLLYMFKLDHAKEWTQRKVWRYEDVNQTRTDNTIAKSVWIRQVFCLLRVQYIGLWSLSGLCRFSVYSEFGLDRFHGIIWLLQVNCSRNRCSILSKYATRRRRKWFYDTHVSASDVHVHHYINEILMSSILAQCSVIYVCYSFDLIVFVNYKKTVHSIRSRKW
jgi:hypothetical protein